MVEGEPDTPTMVVKRDWERNGYHKENTQNQLIVCFYYRKGRHVCEQKYQLSRNYIYQDGADKEPLFAFEDHGTRGAPTPYFERRLKDGRLTTGGTPEAKTPVQQFPQ
ncbi:hypothetical protein BH18ACI4_BH18ACI4_08820 [soil metagenome]